MIDENWIDLKLGSLKVDSKWRGYLESVTIVDNTDGHSGVTVQFSLPGELGLELASDIGKKVYAGTYEVTLKAGSATKRTFIGDIVSFSWDRSGASPRRVTIIGKDQLHRLGRTNPKVKPDGRMLVGKKASEIVKLIADDWGFGSDLDATDAQIPNLDADCTDLALLEKLAKEVGYVVCLGVSGTKPSLIFKRRDKWSEGSAIKLEYGTDIISVSGGHDYSKCYPEVVMYSKDQTSGEDKALEGKSTSSDVKNDNGSASWTGPGLAKESKWYGIVRDLKGSEAATPSLIKERALGELTSAADSFFTGSVTCEFNPEICPGKKVEISGAGWPFDGKFTVKKVTHKMSASGYTTDAELGATGIEAP